MQGLLNASEMHAGECLKSLQDKWGPSCKELDIYTSVFGKCKHKVENRKGAESPLVFVSGARIIEGNHYIWC